MTNRNSLDQAILFHWSMVQSRWSRAQRRRSWRWCLVSRNTWMGRLLRSLTSNSVRWSVCPDTFLLDPVLHLVVNWVIVRPRFCFTKQDNIRRPFDNAWMSNIMSSTFGFTVVHLLCISTNNCRSRTTHESCSFGNACSEPSNHYNLPSIKVA